MARKPIVNLVDSFKLFTSKFNILSNNVGDMEQLTTYQDSDLVTVINEIEAAFDASAGEILYPNGQTGETSTHLKISTNQSSGQDIDIDAGRDFLVDAVADIELTSVNFDGDYSGTYINKVDGTSLDSVGGTITVTGNSTYTLTTGSNFIQNTTGNIDMSASGNFIFDALGDITLDADGNDIIFKNGQGGDTVTHNIADNAHYTVTTPSHYTVDVNGDITFDAEGNDIIFKNGDGNDQVTHSLADGAGYTVTAPGRYTLDVVGDIILDADGNDLVLRNGAGGDSAQINLADNADLTITAPDDFILDVANDIVFDAGGDNIRLKNDGTTRQTYTLGSTTTIATTGNRTETVTVDVSDSAAGTYHIGATGNMDIDTRGTLDVVTGGNLNQNVTGNVTLYNTGQFDIDAGGDIYLDAGDSDIYFQRNNITFVRTRMGVSDDPDYTLHQYPRGSLKLDVNSNFVVDAGGDIYLDAADSDIYFRKNGVSFVKTQMGMAGDATLVRQLYSQGGLELDVAGNFTVDASGDIILDAAADDVILKDNGTEFGRFKHIGDNQLGIYSNGILAASFNDSDVVFNSDVNIEDNLDVDGTLNVDGNTTLNGHVDLGSNGDDNISVLGKFDTNLRPDATNSYTLGTSTLKWRHAYLEQTLFAKNIDVDSADIANLNINTNTISNSTAGLTVDVAGDIVLDAGDSDIFFRRDGVSFAKWQMGIPNNPNALHLKSEQGDFIAAAVGDVILDAGDSDILFQRNGTTFLRHRMGVSGADLFTRMEYPQGGVEIDAAGDITLDASGNDIKLKDDGFEFGRFKHIGSNQLGIYSNGENLALSFSDSDAIFNNDVNIENDLDVDRHLNVDGDTTLNGNVTLGDGTGDDITFTGQVASNIVPKADNAYNLGSSGKEWKHGYFDGTVFADNLDGDSGTIANLNIKSNTIKNTTSNINLDAAGDIILHAAGDDIKFEGRYNSIDSDRVTFDLGNNSNSVTQHVNNRNLVFEVDKNIYLDANEGRVYLRDSASNGRFQVHFTTGTGTEIDVPNGSLTFDVDGDIVLDADGGDVLLKDGGTQFGRFENTSGNLIVRSGDTTAMTFDGANVTMAGQITLPSSDLDKTTKTVHGCINELDSDLGTRTSLSSFYDGHDHDVITALNRVAARIVDVYDENGTLLNN